MFAVSYVITFYWHPGLNLDKISIERSVAPFLEELDEVRYMPLQFLTHADWAKAFQSKHCAIKVSKKKCKRAFSEFISTKSKFAGDCLTVLT